MGECPMEEFAWRLSYRRVSKGGQPQEAVLHSVLL